MGDQAMQTETISLLLVDDEHYVIDGLRRHIPWERLGIEVAGSASSGEEGIRKALELRPDLVMTDIRMPDLDGISMIEKLHELGLHPHFLLFTGYNDFEYAKKAIRFGVSDYILKPSLPDEIAAALSRMADKCRSQKRMVRDQDLLRERFEKDKRLLEPAFIHDLFFGRVQSWDEFAQRDEFLATGLAGKPLCVVAIHVDPSSELFETADIAGQLFVLYQVSSYAVGIFSPGGHAEGFIDNHEYLLVSGNPDLMTQEALLERATRLLDYCTAVHNLTVVIGVSDIVTGFQEVAGAFRQARDCVRNCAVPNTVVFREIAEESGIAFPPVEMGYDREGLIDAVKTANRELVIRYLEQFFASLRKAGANQDIYIAPFIAELAGSVTSALLQIGISYDTEAFRELLRPAQTLQQLQRKTMDYFDSLLERMKDGHLAKNYQVIQRMLAYARDHYGEGITLNAVADALQFTPNYLSTLFSRSMGESFSRYMLHLRIQKAKEFLESGRYKVWEVCEIVGYRNPEYFSKVFKDIVGLSPSAYVK